MKPTFILGVLLAMSFVLNAHEPGSLRPPGMDYYGPRKLAFYIDGLHPRIVPPAFYRIYYRHEAHACSGKPADPDELPFPCDRLFFTSKQAGSGYLTVNYNLSLSMEQYDIAPDNLRVLYEYNGKSVLSPNEILHLIRLKSNNIASYYIEYNPSLQTMTVKISSHPNKKLAWYRQQNIIPGTDLLLGQEDSIETSRSRSAMAEVYMDGLPQQLIPDAFYRHYYHNACYMICAFCSTPSKSQEIWLCSQRPGVGFRDINQKIRRKIYRDSLCLDTVKIAYEYNGRLVSSKADVMRIIRLREPWIDDFGTEYEYDVASGLLTIKIERTRGRKSWVSWISRWTKCRYRPRYDNHLAQFDEQNDSLLWQRIQKDNLLSTCVVFARDSVSTPAAATLP